MPSYIFLPNNPLPPCLTADPISAFWSAHSYLTIILFHRAVPLLHRMFICLLTPLTVCAEQLWLLSNNNSVCVWECVYTGIHKSVCVKSWGVCLQCWEPHLHTLTCVQTLNSVGFKLTQLSWCSSDRLREGFCQANVSFALNLIIDFEAGKQVLKYSSGGTWLHVCQTQVCLHLCPTCCVFTNLGQTVICSNHLLWQYVKS